MFAKATAEDGTEFTSSEVICASGCPGGKPSVEQYQAAQDTAQASAEYAAAKHDYDQAKKARNYANGVLWQTKVKGHDTAAAYAKAVAAAKAEWAAKQKLEEAKQKLEDAQKKQAEAEAAEYDPDESSLSDCQMAVARALIECLAPMAMGEEGIGHGMTCEGHGACGDASVADGGECKGDEAGTVGLTVEVNGGSCECDEESEDAKAEMLGQMSFLLEGGGVVDPAPVD